MLKILNSAAGASTVKEGPRRGPLGFDLWVAKLIERLESAYILIGVKIFFERPSLPDGEVYYRRQQAENVTSIRYVVSRIRTPLPIVGERYYSHRQGSRNL